MLRDQCRFDGKQNFFYKLLYKILLLHFPSPKVNNHLLCSTPPEENSTRPQSTPPLPKPNRNSYTPKVRRVRRLEDGDGDHEGHESEHDGTKDERPRAWRARRRFAALGKAKLSKGTTPGEHEGNFEELIENKGTCMRWNCLRALVWS